MTTFRSTLNTYITGNTLLAYTMFKEDKNAIDVSYSKFCEGFDRIIKDNNSKSITPR